MCDGKEEWKGGRMRDNCRVYCRINEDNCEARIVNNDKDLDVGKEVIHVIVR